ncbi:TauD/TfdA family dioxygenase [Actinoallomurus acaciae]|uniref:TauD/TfdA family dioxygenase n=1 Tax=Actinoallomurus acaciae TaxID=502577 RepID=A0ABV5YJV0_9ACTN
MMDTLFPHLVEGSGSVTERIRAERGDLRSRLRGHGALLFRGFDIGDADGLEAAVRALAGEPLTYTEQSTPREVIKGNVYTSTEYPAHAEIPLHTEMSYQATWPRTLFFHCVTPPETQGATPLAPTRAVHEAIDPRVRDEFDRRGWMLVRNYGEDIGLRWRHAFGTDDRSEVERYCAGAAIEPTWLGDEQLRTRAIRSAVHTHPETGDPVWFNHIVIFHSSSLPDTVRDTLIELYGAEGLPHNTFYGDGEPIPDEVVEHVRSAYRSASTRFSYEPDDLLVIDNMLVAHGREPFTGKRRIAVAMAEPSS